MTVDEQVAFYVALLIQQYVKRPKAEATVDAFVREVVADQVWNGIFEGFDLDTAVGVQLDTLAAFRGISRNVVGLNFGRNYVILPSYDDVGAGSVKGLASYDDIATPDWFFLRYEDTNRSTYAMTDDELRRAVKFVAACHASHLGVGDVDAILHTSFAGNVTLNDNLNMTIQYTEVDTTTSDKLYNIISSLKAFPKPAGVALTTVP